jgi:hypothetical protein
MDLTCFDLSIRRANNVLSWERNATMAILDAKPKTATPQLDSRVLVGWPRSEWGMVSANSGFCRMGFRPPTGSIRPEDVQPGRHVLETEPLRPGGGAGPS